MDSRELMLAVARQVEALNLQGPAAHKKEIVSLLRDNSRRHRLHEVFTDFVELGALGISYAVDQRQREKRDGRFADIVRRYERHELDRFPRMLAVLVRWLECGFADCLGDLFMSLELGNSARGQFFTPYELSALMARITIGDVRSHSKQHGFITLNEPACGSGGMLIACADAIHEQGENYQQVMHAIAVDVDATAVHMAYLQLSLLHVPAIVIHGNTLTLEEWAHWVTPSHVMGGWDARLRLRKAMTAARQLLELPSASPEVTAAAEAVATTSQTIIAPRTEQLGLFS